jgi:hypothetical protein
VLLDVGLYRLFGMTAGVNGVAGGGVGMVSGRFVLAPLMVLGGFYMMAGGMGQVL